MIRSISILLLFVLPCIVNGAEELGPMPKGKDASKAWNNKGRAMAGQIAELLATDDPANHSKAFNDAKILLKARLAFLTGTKNDGVIKYFYSKKKYEQLVELCDFGIIAHPESTVEVQILQRFKVQSLLELGKFREAIPAAKSYYNVSKLASTDESIKMLVLSLEKSGVESNRKLAESIQLEIKQSVSVPVDVEQLSKALGRLKSLESIKVDSSSCDEAIKKIKPSGWIGLVAKGNLQLLGDRVHDAEVTFAEAYQYVEAKNLKIAAEDVARAMRANDGHSSRARIWLETPFPAGAMSDPREAVPQVAKSTDIPRPLQVLAEIGGNDKLSKWFSSWESGSLVINSKEDIDSLETILKESKLNTDQSLKLLRSILPLEDRGGDLHSLPYRPVSAAVARFAMNAGSDELAENPKRRDIVIAKIAPLVERLRHGNKKDAVAYGIFYSLLAKYCVPGEPDYARGLIGHIESLMQQGETELAITECIAAEKKLDHFQPDQRANLNLNRGLILMTQNKFKEAAEFLKTPAGSQTYRYAQLANLKLIKASIFAGDQNGANEAMKQWIERYRPSNQLIAAQFSEMDRYKALALSNAGVSEKGVLP